MLAFPHKHTVSTGFAMSLVDQYGEGVHIHPERCYPGDDLALGRDRIVRKFLDDTTFDWLWMVDTDIVLPPGALDGLTHTAMWRGHDQLPVVSGLYHIQVESEFDKYGQPQKTEAKPCAWRFDVEWGLRTIDHPDIGVQRVEATGAGCLLMHRESLELVRNHYSRHEWFRIIRHSNGLSMGEDISFCYRLLRAGVPLYVDYGIHCAHQKETWI